MLRNRQGLSIPTTGSRTAPWSSPKVTPPIRVRQLRTFCSLKRFKKTTVRRLDSITIERLGDETRFNLSGSGFLYNMVRILVGTLVEVGLGERSPGSVGEALASLDRQQAGQTAPAQGLILWDVRY